LCHRRPCMDRGPLHQHDGGGRREAADDAGRLDGRRRHRARLAPHWSWRLEYLYSQFENGGVRFSNGASYTSTLEFQTLRVGLNRKLDFADGPDLKLKSDPSDPESDRWEIHGQATVIGQGYPSFRAPYTGTNSLTPARQFQETWSNSLFINARLWDGGEVYYNPELLQGFGLSNTVGLGGFANGEAQKSDFPYP